MFLQPKAVATTAAAHAIGGATWPLAAFLLAAQQGREGRNINGHRYEFLISDNRKSCLSHAFAFFPYIP